jgi:ACS family hexuronate transporter-like MFS transporter
MLRWRMALMVSVAIAISYLDRQTFPTAFKAISGDIHFDKTDKATLDSAFLVAYGLMYIGGGRLMDWLGTRRGFLVVMVFWSLACASHGLATGFWMLAASRLMLGLGEGGGFPAATRATAEWFPVKERSTAMGMMNAGTAVGSIVAGPLILIWILPHVHWFGVAPWRWAFIITGASGLLWSLWWVLDYERPELRRDLSNAERDLLRPVLEGAAAERRTPISIGRLLQFRETRALMAAKFLTDAAWYFYLFWLPIYLLEARGYDYKSAGEVIWIPPAASGIGCLCGGALSSWLIQRGKSVNAARKIALGASAACMPFVMLVPFVSVPWTIAIFSLAFFGQQSWSTLVMVLPTDLFPKRAVGTVAGFVGFGGAMGGVALGQFAGYLLDHDYSYKPILTIAALLHLAAFGLILLAIPRLTPLPIDSDDAPVSGPGPTPTRKALA